MNKLIYYIRRSIIAQMTVLVFAIFGVLSFLIYQSLRSFNQIEKSNAQVLTNTILTQTENSLNSYYDSLERTAQSFGYSPTVLKYFREDAMEKVEDISGLKAVFANTLLLDDHIKSIQLYKNDMQQISALGTDYVLPERQKRLRVVGELNVDNYQPASKDELSFAFYLPIFDLSSGTYMDQLGMCVFLLDSEALDDTLKNSLSAMSSAVELKDTSGRVLSLQTTDDMKGLERIEDIEGMKGFGSTHGTWMKNGWKITTVVSIGANAGNIMKYRNILNLALWLAILLMAALISFSYLRLARPIRKIHEFIETVIFSPSKRLRLSRLDDIGIVANSLDHLLDENQKSIHEIRENKIMLYEMEISRQKMSLLAYRNQINPHFLYNTFACISGMALMHDEDDIAELTMCLSDIFRYAVKGGDVVSVSDELSNLEKYGKIISYRFMGKIKIEQESDEDVKELPMLKMLLQPIVENAVFHGLEQKLGDGKVKVRLWKSQGRIRIMVQDDGSGISAEKLKELKKSYDKPDYLPEYNESRVPDFMKPLNEVAGTGRDLHRPDDEGVKKSSGIGIGNILERLRLFYGKTYTFIINSTEGEGTTVSITVPDHIVKVFSENKEKG
ncbi:two-component system, sensor histidine kinase YesM [Lachnospiraceae bacterium KH1T2]|nr:two-component system, sensor histidine kinase YesM [Lachnospiraceae bacterium KH1T2]